MITVLLADDDVLVRQGLRVLVESAGDLTVVAEAADGDQAVELAEATRPDVVVMDVRMTARAVGLRGGTLLVRPDGVPAALESMRIPLARDCVR